MSGVEDNGSRRISVDLPNQLIERFDELKKEWGLRARGAVLRKLLEVILSDNDDLFNSNESNNSTDNELQNSSTIKSKNIDQPRYNETKALVLIGNNEIVRSSYLNDSNVNKSDISENDNDKAKSTNTSGIDLPGFVQRRTSNLRKSLGKDDDMNTNECTFFKTIGERELLSAQHIARNHWIEIYGKYPSESVLEASMVWLSEDIWPNIEGTDDKLFTWSAANRLMKNYCPNWQLKGATFEKVIVIVGILEDPFAADTLHSRIPTLIRRFVNRFKKSRNVTSFETIESTMTVHGALKLLGLPTIAGQPLTLVRIRESYKQKALESHPDAGGSTESMRKLNEAYQLLKELYRNSK